MNQEEIDPRRTKEAKARSTWKWLIHARREKMSLDEFTTAVNQHQGGDYVPFELERIFKELRIATTLVPSYCA
jgi:hypothetical protein